MDPIKRLLNIEIKLLYNLSKSFSNISEDPSNLIKESIRAISDIEGIRRVAFYIVDTASSKISLAYSIGIDEKNVSIDKKEGVVGFIAREGYPVVIKNLSDELIFLNKIKRDDLNDVSFIGIPIKYGGKTVGVITIDVVKDFIGLDYLFEMCVMISNLLSNYTYTYQKLMEKEHILKYEIATLKKEVIKKFKMDGFVGVSKAYKDIVNLVLKLANLDVTVMLRGESGTGKTTIAKTIHYLSNRKNKPFVEVNCSAIPNDLLEAELFGYEKGAFTGAYTTKIGKVEIANGGTLFFDEIGDLNPAVQAKLLRFLQTKEFERLGSSKTLKSDTRIIVATNRNLEEMVAKNEFREDLYYRISVYPVYIQPLRERKEDIPAIVEYYLEQLSKTIGKELKIDQDALRLLISCDFPGNIRELINCLTRSAIESATGYIKPENISCSGTGLCFSNMIKKYRSQNESDHQDNIKNKYQTPNHSQHSDTKEQKDEKAIILEALEKTGYVQAKAARLLGITLRQLNYRIKKYGIDIKKI